MGQDRAGQGCRDLWTEACGLHRTYTSFTRRSTWLASRHADTRLTPRHDQRLHPLDTIPEEKHRDAGASRAAP